MKNENKTDLPDDVYRRLVEATEKAQKVEDIDIETLLALDGAFDVGGIKIPPATAAVLSLLEIIESPFLVTVGREEVSILDVYSVLYVLVNREMAVNPILAAKHNKDKSKGMAEFQACVLAWSDDLQPFDYYEAISKIQAHIFVAMGGFSFLPKHGVKGEGEFSPKKKETLTQNG